MLQGADAMALAQHDLNGFAVDLGGTKIAAARLRAGEIVARRQVQTDGAASPEKQIVAMLGLLQMLGFRRGDALGVAVTGRIDRKGLWHAVNTGTLRAVEGFALAEAVFDAIGPAVCSNDAAAATLAEAYFGAGRGLLNFAYLTISTGVGGGLVLGGRLLDSTNGLAGHVGFTTSPEGSGLCGCGRHATVESAAGGRAIAAAAQAAGYDVDARAVSEAALAGAPWAEVILARSSRAVATLVADLTTILGLDGVAIGGSLGLSPTYIDRVRLALSSEPALFQVPVMVADFGTDAPLIGALAIEQSAMLR
jgi:N-acylmannosamine kinase